MMLMLIHTRRTHVTARTFRRPDQFQENNILRFMTPTVSLSPYSHRSLSSLLSIFIAYPRKLPLQLLLSVSPPLPSCFKSLVSISIVCPLDPNNNFYCVPSHHIIP
jgi:hypothetical protein